MLPLWYTLFEEYARLGRPVVRTLFWDFLEDPETHSNPEALENEIMLGEHLLVHGVSNPMSQQTSANVYLPKGKHGGWYGLEDGKFYAPGQFAVDLTLDSIPAYWRAGTVVPLRSRIRRSSECMKQDPLTLAVYLTPEGEAKGRVYLDDFRTHAYKDGKSFLSVEFTFANGELRATAVNGELPDGIAAEVERVEIFGLPKAAGETVLEDKSKQHKLSLPVSRPIASADATRYASVVKVQPWINLRDGLAWSLKVGF